MDQNTRLIASIRLSVAIPLLATAAAVHAQPVTKYLVDATAPAGGNGLTWSTAFRDLQDALAAPRQSGDLAEMRVIKIAGGVYAPDRGTHDPNRSFVLTSGVTLLGGFAGRSSPNPDLRNPAAFQTVLDGDLGAGAHAISVVRIARSAAFATIDGLTIRGGRGGVDGGYGGGVSFPVGTGPLARAIIRGCTFSSNQANSAGGAIHAAGEIEISDCVFVGNSNPQGSGGGAISASTPNSHLSIARCVFSGNTAVKGGAIVLTGVGNVCSIDRCIFVGNVAEFDGGAIGPGGGGDISSLSIRSCVFAGNVSTRSLGGAVYIAMHLTSGELQNLTFYNNTATRASSLWLSGNNLHIGSSIFWNSTPVASQIEIFYVTESSISDCDIQGGAAGISGQFIGTNNILNIDPRFVNPSGPDGDLLTWQDDDFRLSSFSPLIDAGPAPDPLSSTLDLDGNPFKADGNLDGAARIDIGAYEFSAGTTACPADFDGDGAITPTDVSLYIRAWFDALSHGCP